MDSLKEQRHIKRGEIHNNRPLYLTGHNNLLFFLDWDFDIHIIYFLYIIYVFKYFRAFSVFDYLLL